MQGWLDDFDLGEHTLFEDDRIVELNEFATRDEAVAAAGRRSASQTT